MFTGMSASPRPYRLRKRREQQEDTRQRIVEATVSLHREVGPAATSISAIAERAGVQRLTVYRHFPDEGSLFDACSAHWNAAYPAPDPARWAGLPSPGDRLRVALEALYAYYAADEPMLVRVLRDSETLPALAERVEPLRRYLRSVADDLAQGWRTPNRRLLRAAIRHAVAFDTWRSLAAQGLRPREGAGLMAAMVEGLERRGK
jgi:AcrR family transcriptional regulator